MNIIGIIIVGFFIGLVARFIKPGNDRMGLLLTTIVGISGAFVGRFLGQAMGLYRADEPAEFIGAVIGAILILALIKFSTNKRIAH